MLVLTRNREESIIIGDNAEITIKVLSTDGNKVRIGIAAPSEVAVHREEIYQRIQQQKQAS